MVSARKARAGFQSAAIDQSCGAVLTIRWALAANLPVVTRTVC
jgi:hypothetical protein